MISSSLFSSLRNTSGDAPKDVLESVGELERILKPTLAADFLHQPFGVAAVARRRTHFQTKQIAIRRLMSKAAEEPTEICLIDLAFLGDLLQ